MFIRMEKQTFLVRLDLTECPIFLTLCVGKVLNVTVIVVKNSIGYLRSSFARSTLRFITR